jgi:predicted nuclease of predicted toxin-antitoxin system
MSPDYALRLNKTGEHDAVHPRNDGGLGEQDHTVLARCVREDRIIVTGNAADFRRLVSGVELHPGLILLPNLAREPTWTLLLAAIAAIAAEGEWRTVMVNRVLEIDSEGNPTFYELP